MKVLFWPELCVFRFFRTMLGVTFMCLVGCLAAAGQDQKLDQKPDADNKAGQTGKPAESVADVLPGSVADQSKIKVEFDDKTPGIVIVESNGEKIRIDTTRKTVERVALALNEQDSEPTASNVAVPDDDEESAYDFERGEEPYDSRVVNLPTPKSVPKGTWNLTFTHRFTQPVHPISDSGPNLLGLDSFGIASFGMTYGITDQLYVSAYRSPLCQTGLCRVIEVGLGYNWIAHDKGSPIALTTYASIEGNDNFTEEFTYNLQAMFSGRVGKRVYLFFSPAVHINSNGQRRFDPRAGEFFPPATVAETFRQPKHGATFGFGASVLITPNVLALFDVAARTGFKLGTVVPIRDGIFGPITGFRVESHPSIGLGIQRNVGKHSFALTFSNTQSTTTSRYNSSNLTRSPKRLIIGFNLSRRF